MTNIQICTLTDNNYVQHLGVLITSILVNSKSSENFTFNVLDGGIFDSEKEKIEQLKRIKNFNIFYHKINKDDFAKCPILYHNIATYYRLKFQSYLTSVDKAIYFDPDVIVLNSLSELWEIDINDYFIAGVEDPLAKKNMSRLDISEEYNYFNAGVLILNLKKFRENNIEEKLFNYIENHSDKIVWADQDILNDNLHKNALILPLKWNSMEYNLEESTYSDFDEYKNAYNNPNVIHFISPDKPWNYKSKEPRKHLYNKYLNMSPWKISGRLKKLRQIPQYNYKKLQVAFKFFFRHPLFIFSKSKRKAFLDL